MASGVMVNGGDGGSKRVGESKVYKRKKSFSKEDEAEQQGDQIVGLDSGKEDGFFKQENRVTISLSRKTKREVREVRRKLESELKSIRSLVKKIETKEGRKNGKGARGGVLKRVHSDVGSISGGAIRESRPSALLSVSVPSQNVSDSVEKEKRTPKANQFYKKSEFLLAKDKFPPAESNKKSKASGKKGELPDNRDGSASGTFTKQALKNCSSLLDRLMKHKLGWVFKTPVDAVALGLHDYYDIIKHPMDLGTVKSKLTNNLYKSPREFAEDVRLTFRNAMTYNPAGQDVHSMAEQLLNIFEDKWEVVETEYLQELKLAVDHGSGPPIPTSRKTAQVSAAGQTEPPKKVKKLATSGRTANPKKPKARDPNKRDMTLDEKQKLSSSLQNLPSEKLENVVQIIKKRNSSLCQHDDEIEVDIDSVDIETLWELDRFVTNHKKSSTKTKKMSESTNQAAPEAEENVHEKNSPTDIGTPSRKESEEEPLSATPAAEAKNQGGDAGRSSSASSSSSGSGSSSSDSDSES